VFHVTDSYNFRRDSADSCFTGFGAKLEIEFSDAPFPLEHIDVLIKIVYIFEEVQIEYRFSDNFYPPLA